MSLYSKLRINDRTPEIVELVANNRKVAIQAATGEGKSLGIPIALALEGELVYVSVPTRAAAIALSERAREILRDLTAIKPVTKKVWGKVVIEPLSQKDQELSQKASRLRVGYAAEGDKRYDNNTQIVYGTNGHWRRRLEGFHAQAGKWRPIRLCSVMMLDEVHTGSMETELTFLMLKHAEKTTMIPKIILSSATFDPERYPEFVPIKIERTGFPVEVVFTDRDFSVTDEKLIEKACEQVKRIINGEIASPGGGRSILMFVPGSKEAEEAYSILSESLDEKILLKVAYSALPKEELDKIFAPLGPGQWQVIIATNIAETALTLDVDFVVDLGLEKRAASTSLGGLRLELCQISRFSAEQRKGRVGRIRPGVCVRMWSKSYDERFQERKPDEIDTIPRYPYILSLLDAKLNPFEVFSGRVEEDSILRDVEILERLGLMKNPGLEMLDSLFPMPQKPSTVGLEWIMRCHIESEFENRTYECKRQREEFLKSRRPFSTVTPMGHFVPSVPLGPRLGSVLFNWISAGLNPYPAIVLLSLIECHGPPYFRTPRRNPKETFKLYERRIEEHVCGNFGDFIGKDDVETLMNFWTIFIKEVGTDHSGKNQKNISRFCNKHSINFRKFLEAIHNIKQCLRAMDSKGIDYKPTMGSNIDYLRVEIKRVFSDHRMFRNATPKRTFYVNKETGVSHILASRFCTIETDQAEKIVALESVEIEGKTGRTVCLVSMAMICPTKREVLEADPKRIAIPESHLYSSEESESEEGSSRDEDPAFKLFQLAGFEMTETQVIEMKRDVIAMREKLLAMKVDAESTTETEVVETKTEERVEVGKKKRRNGPAWKGYKI